MRVRKRNLVYLIGLSQGLANESLLAQRPYLGQYGTIRKIIVNAHSPFHRQTHISYSAYVTYEQETDAAFAIIGLDGFEFEDHTLRASFGMTKYCSFFLRNIQCTSSDCLFLHKVGRKEDMVKRDDEIVPKLTSQADLDSLTSLVASNYLEILHARVKALGSQKPVLSSVKLVYELASKIAKLNLVSAKIKTLKTQKELTPAKTRGLNRWDDESETEQKSEAKPKIQEKSLADSVGSTQDEAVPSKPTSLARTQDNNSEQTILSRSGMTSPSPIIRKQTNQKNRKVSKSQEKKRNLDTKPDQKTFIDFSDTFIAENRDVFDLGSQILRDPLSDTHIQQLFNTELDKCLANQLTQKFSTLSMQRSSAFRLLKEDPYRIEDDRKRPLLEELMGRKTDHNNSSDSEFHLYNQTFTISKRF